MKTKYQTIYETTFGTITSVFKEEMTFKQAEKIAKEYCVNNGFKYLKTEETVA